MLYAFKNCKKNIFSNYWLKYLFCWGRNQKQNQINWLIDWRTDSQTDIMVNIIIVPFGHDR